MQFSRYLTYRKSSSLIRFWPWVLKLFLAVASFYYVFSKFLEEQLILSEAFALLNSVNFVLLLLVVVILMGLNWLLESKKWQLLANQMEPVSLSNALKAILTGVSFDAILPFGAGAVGSKVLSLKGRGRQKLIAPVVAAQGIQSFCTVVFGLFGLIQLAQMTNVLAMYGSLNMMVALSILAVLLVVAVANLWPEKTKNLLQAIKNVPGLVWLKITALSFFRYGIFLVQLLLLSVFLAPEIPIPVLLGCITWMFFAKTIVPKPGHLGALGIRGASVVFFLTLAGYPFSGVMLATLVLWCINLAIPSLAGLFFIKNLNFRTDTQQ